MKKLFLIISLFFSVNCFALEPVTLKGRVVLGEDGIERAKVTIRNLNSGELLSVNTDQKGYFEIELSPDSYFIEAEALVGKKNYRGFTGKNPVFINSDTYLGIKLLPPSKVKITRIKSRDVVLKIRALQDGKPVNNARAYLYLSEKDIKGMPYLYSEPSDNKGQIKISGILPNRYFILLRKKKNLSPLGPISDGDLIGFYSGRYLDLKEGMQYSLDIHMFVKAQDDITKPLDIKEGFIIRGRALDEKDTPIQGVYAFLYTRKEMGHERPVSISAKTGKDGIFELIVPRTGVYYLGVREFYGGTPVQGELYGTYDLTYDHHIKVFSNITGISIRVRRILR